VQRDARAKTVSAKNLPQTVVFKAWHIPARSAPDYFVAEILAGILTNGKSSRLLNELVKQKKVSSSIGAFSWQLHDTGQFSINAQLVPGVTPEAFELALAESLQRLGSVTQAEVNRKIEQLYSEELFDRATVSSRALSIAMADVLGDPERVNTELDTLRAITADQVKAFASKYLQPTNCSTLYYQPE
jgi:predicted Zn-dependent peptidase